MIKFYGYNKCSTCRQAKSLLDKHGLKVRVFDIITQPPSKSTLQAILKLGEYKLGELFNRSGWMYRDLNMKEKLKTMDEAALLDLLSKNGKLIKRPIITNGKKHTVGFDDARMKQVWL